MEKLLNQDSTIKFVFYDKFDPEQKKFLNEIESDNYINKYINNIAGDIKKSIECTSDNISLAFLVRDKSINEYIGLFTVKNTRCIDNAVTIEYAIHKKYRHLPEKYGTRLLNKICNSIFLANPFNLETIILEIAKDNEHSLMIAKHLGFIEDYELHYQFSLNDYPYIPFCKHNPCYNKIQEIRSQTYTYNSTTARRKA